jgi:hypothetical protein
MPRTRKTPRKERKRVVKVQFVPRPAKKSKTPDPLDPYAILDAMVRDHHDDLAQARIAVAWMLDVKADRDGHLTLGRCKKATDLDREFREFDLVILLNAQAWKELEPKQRVAVVDHFLCRATVAEDKNAEPIKDERDRLCYRMRTPDIVEFMNVVKRHGLYLADVAEFVKQAIGPHAGEKPLFGPGENGEAAKE